MSVKSTRLDDDDDYDSTQQKESNSLGTLLTTLEPAIQHTTHLIRILLWRRGYTYQSILLTLIWTFFWFHSIIVSSTLPLALYFTFPQQTDPQQQKERSITTELTDELKELQIELQSILPPPNSFHQFVQDHGVSCYLVWIALLQLYSVEKIIWFLGMVVLTWHSSLFKIMRGAYHRVFCLFSKPSNVPIVDDQTLQQTNNEPTKDYQLDRYYHFVVIEHQRWWLHKGGWSTSLLANDRPAWSDEYLSEVPSIDQFHLPPPTTRINKTISWKWTSDQWEIDFNHNVDKNGWEYGNWYWTCWSTKSFGPSRLTRRRYWVRNARLVETVPIIIKKAAAPSTVASSFSSSSEDSFMCSTPTSISPPIMKTSWSASTTSILPTTTMDDLWLHQ